MAEQIIKVHNIYVMGNGKVSLGVGSLSNSDIPFISVAKMEKAQKVGSSLVASEVDEQEITILSFKNIEGFNVFKKAMNKVEKTLKKQSKLLKND